MDTNKIQYRRMRTLSNEQMQRNTAQPKQKLKNLHILFDSVTHVFQSPYLGGTAFLLDKPENVISRNLYKILNQKFAVRKTPQEKVNKKQENEEIKKNTSEKKHCESVKKSEYETLQNNETSQYLAKKTDYLLKQNFRKRLQTRALPLRLEEEKIEELESFPKNISQTNDKFDIHTVETSPKKIMFLPKIVRQSTRNSENRNIAPRKQRQKQYKSLVNNLNIKDNLKSHVENIIVFF